MTETIGSAPPMIGALDLRSMFNMRILSQIGAKQSTGNCMFARVFDLICEKLIKAHWRNRLPVEISRVHAVRKLRRPARCGTRRHQQAAVPPAQSGIRSSRGNADAWIFVRACP